MPELLRSVQSLLTQLKFWSEVGRTVWAIPNEMTAGGHGSQKSAPRATRQTPDVLDNVRLGLCHTLQNIHYNVTTQYVRNFSSVKAILRELLNLWIPEVHLLCTVGKHEIIVAGYWQRLWSHALKSVTICRCLHWKLGWAPRWDSEIRSCSSLSLGEEQDKGGGSRTLISHTTQLHLIIICFSQPEKKPTTRFVCLNPAEAEYFHTYVWIA